MEDVAAGLHHSDHGNARNRHFRVVARALDLHLFERAVIEIDGGVLVGAHRDVHAFHLQLRLQRHAVAGEVLALRHRAAADVGNRLRHARRHRKHVLEVVAARNRVENFFGERHAGRRARDVDNRALAAHGDRLLHGTDFQREIDARVEADRQP